MLEPSAIRRAWERTHQEKPSSDQPEAELVALIKRLQARLSPGTRALDAGCGKGRNALYLAGRGFTVYGCDLSPTALRSAKARAGQGLKFQTAHLAHLPYPDNSFAGVACVRVLPYHLKADIAATVREFWRVLRPGGWLYADFLDRDDAEYSCGQKLEEHTFLDPDGMPIHFSSRQEIDELLSGFALERVAYREMGSGPRPRVAWVVWATKYKGDENA